MELTKLIIGVTEQSYSLICYKVTKRVELLSCELYDAKAFNQKTIKKFISAQGLNQIEAQLILGSKLYRMLTIDRPNIQDEEIAQAAQWLAKDLINEKLEEVVVDAFPIVERVSKTNKLYIAIANKKYLQNLYDTCHMAGAHLTLMTISEFGLLQFAPDNNNANAIVYSPEEDDIRVLIICNGEIDFIRSIKIKMPITQDNESRCEEVALELNRSVDFYITQFGNTVQDILYVPCTYFSEDFMHLLKQKMTINIEILYDNNFSSFLGDNRWNEHIMAFGLIPNFSAENKDDSKN